MKKLLVIVGMTLVLIAVGLSGCTETTENNGVELTKFVGTWKLDKNDRNWTITFFSNGTCSGTITGNRYEIKDGKLICFIGTGYTPYDYYFSENDTKLHLRYGGTDGHFSVYIKQ